MKETQAHQPDTMLVTQVTGEKKTQLNYLGSVKMHKGHTCFELNLKTGEVKKADYKQETLDFQDAKRGFSSSRKKLVVNQYCIYETALNIKNAERKFKQRLSKMKD